MTAAAAVPFFMVPAAVLFAGAVMVVTVRFADFGKGAVKEHPDRLVRVAFRTREKPDPGRFERCLRPAADAAADDDVRAESAQHVRKRAVAGPVRGNDLSRLHFSVFDLVYLKRRGASEMLKNFPV